MVVGAKVLGCSLGGDSLLGKTWMEVCRVGCDVVRGLRLEWWGVRTIHFELVGEYVGTGASFM